MTDNTMGSTKRKITCYSEGEQKMMDLSQRIRALIFGPLLRLLASLGVTPNNLTLLSLFSGLAFCFLFQYSKITALILLVFHVFLDGLDGPLARETGRASNQGSFTDTTSDQVVVALSTLTLIYYGYIHIIPGGLYIFFYTVVVIFAMIRNSLSIPYSWVVRPRFYVYAWIPVELYFLPGTMNYLIWFFSILLALKMLSGFLRIQKNIE
jgi:phosphatidylglycerophosphate synthase